MSIASFFKNLTKSKDPNSKRARWDMAEMICGKHIRYVTEKKNDVAEIDNLQIWELLSKDGVVLTGYDKETQCERTVIAYYVYYRK